MTSTTFVYLGDRSVINIKDLGRMDLSCWGDLLVDLMEYESSYSPSDGIKRRTMVFKMFLFLSVLVLVACVTVLLVAGTKQVTKISVFVTTFSL